MTTFNQEFQELVNATLLDKNQEKKGATDDVNIQDMNESAKSQDFFLDNNAIGKKCTTTRIKSRNFLSNIVYVGINKEDYYNHNFIFDVYLLLTKNVKAFSLDRKLTDKTKHELIYMIWKEFMPTAFYKHICKEKNFLYLNGKSVLQPKVLNPISGFIKKDERRYKMLQNNLSSYKNIYQYVNSNVFSEIYCATEKRVFDLKSNFHIIFKTYKNKKQIESSMGKNSDNYESIRNETNINEQKPININDFNEAKEAEIKKRVEKRKQKRREVAEKNKLFKKKRKQEEIKIKEKDM